MPDHNVERTTLDTDALDALIEQSQEQLAGVNRILSKR